MLPCILDKVINFKTAFSVTKNSTHVIGALEGCIYKTFFELAFLPYVAITNIETFIKSFYRINFSKKISNGLDKPTTKFTSGMIFGIENI